MEKEEEWSKRCSMEDSAVSPKAHLGQVCSEGAGVPGHQSPRAVQRTGQEPVGIRSHHLERYNEFLPFKNNIPLLQVQLVLHFLSFFHAVHAFAAAAVLPAS